MADFFTNLKKFLDRFADTTDRMYEQKKKEYDRAYQHGNISQEKYEQFNNDYNKEKELYSKLKK